MRIVLKNGQVMSEGEDNDYVWRDGKLAFHYLRRQGISADVIRVLEVEGYEVEFDLADAD